MLSLDAKVLDRISKHQQRRRAEVTTLLLEIKPTDLILDVGCGDGSVTKHFAPHAGYTIGVDVSMRLLGEARSKFRSTNVSLVLGEATKLPFQLSCFDKIVALEVLEHLPNPKLCIKEVDRCIKKKTDS